MPLIRIALGNTNFILLTEYSNSRKFPFSNFDRVWMIWSLTWTKWVVRHQPKWTVPNVFFFDHRSRWLPNHFSAICDVLKFWTGLVQEFPVQKLLLPEFLPSTVHRNASKFASWSSIVRSFCLRLPRTDIANRYGHLHTTFEHELHSSISSCFNIEKCNNVWTCVRLHATKIRKRIGIVEESRNFWRISSRE